MLGGDDGGSKSGWTILQQAVFQALLVQAYETFVAHWIVLLGIAVEMLQVLGLLVRSPLSQWWAPEVLNSIAPLARVFDLDATPQNVLLLNIIVSMWLVTMALLALALHKKVQLAWLLKLARVQSSLHQSVLLLPCISTLLRRIACADCWAASIDTLPLTLWTVANLVAYLPLLLAVVASFFDVSTTSDSALARSHARADLVYAIFRFAIALGIGIVGRYLPWIAAAVATVGAVFTASIFVRWQPYFHRAFVEARVAQLAAISWTGVCLAAALLQKKPASLGPSLALLTGLPMLPPTAMLLVRSQRPVVASNHEALQNAIESGASPFAIDMSVRRAVDALRRKKNTSVTVDALAAVFHNTVSTSATAPAALHVLVARFSFEMADNAFVGLLHLQRADAKAPAIDLQFLIFRQRTEMVHAMSSASPHARDVLAYLSAERNTRSALLADLEATKACVKLWDELMQAGNAVIDDAHLLQHGLDTSRQRVVAKQHYERAFRVNPDATALMRFFGSFLRDVLDEPAQAAVMLERVDEIDEVANAEQPQKKQATAMAAAVGQQQNATELAVTAGRFRDALFSSNNAVVVISGGEASFAQITWANAVALHMFGYREDEVVGRNVAIMMPDPFAGEHDAMMRCNLTKNSLKVVNSERLLLGKSKAGFLLPLNVLIKSFTEDGVSLKFLAVMTPMSTSYTHHMLVGRDLVVTGVSRGIIDLFRVTIDDVAAGTVRITDLLPDYLSNRGAYLRPSGHKLILSHHQFKIRVNVDEFVYAKGKSVDTVDVVSTGENRVSVAVAAAAASAAAAVTAAQASKTPGAASGVASEKGAGSKSSVGRDRAGSAFDESSSLEEESEDFEEDDGEDEDTGDSEDDEEDDDEDESGEDGKTDESDEDGDKESSSKEEISDEMESFTISEKGASEKQSHQSELSVQEDAVTLEMSMEDGGGAKTVDSVLDGSVSSGQSDGRQILDHIREELSSGKKAMATQRVQMVFFASMILAAMMAVTVLIVTELEMEQHMEQVAMIRKAGDRRLASVTLAYDVHELELIQQGLIGVDQTELIQKELREAADLLLLRDIELYTDSSAHNEAQNELLVTPMLPMSESNGFGKTLRMEALWEAHLLTAARSRSLANEYSKDLTKFVLSNSLGALEELQGQSMAEFEGRSRDVVAKVHLVTQIMLLLTTLVMLGAVLRVLRPAIDSIHVNKLIIIEIFTRVPGPVSKRLASSCRRRLAYVGARLEYLRGFAAAPSQCPHTSRLSAAGLGDANNVDAVAAHHRINEIGEMEGEESSDSRRRADSRKRTWRVRQAKRQRYSKALVLLSMSLVFMMCTAYFAVVNFYALAAVEPALLYSPAEIKVSSERTWATRRLLLLLRGLASGGERINSSSSAVRLQMSTLQQLHFALLFGDEALGVPGTVHSRVDVHSTILFRSACQLPTAAASAISATTKMATSVQWRSSSECSTFASGVMASGLHTAMMEYIEMAQHVLALIEARCNTSECRQNISVKAELLAGAELGLMQEMERGYMFPALQASQDLFEQDLRQNRFREFRMTMSIASVLGVLLIALTYARIYRPHQDALEDDVQRSRALLQLLPSDIAEWDAVSWRQ